MLNNALVARMRMHTGGSPTVSASVPTASQFIEQRRPMAAAAAPMHMPHPPPNSPGVVAGHAGYHNGVAGHFVAHQPAGGAVPTAMMIGGFQAFSRAGMPIGPRTYSLDNKIDLGGANAHDGRRSHR